MFTTKHLDKVLGEVRGFHKKSHFCPKKSLLSYRLSKMSSQYRGQVLEKMVRDYYISRQKKVVYFGGNASFDMLVDNKRIEVKSALAKMDIVRGKIQYSYNFRHICPHNFHKLVLVFVSPFGINIRVMDTQTVAKYLGARKQHRSLYIRKKILGKALAA